MGFVTALRVLWRHRLLVAAWAVVSIAVGVLMTYDVKGPTSFSSRQYTVGLGSARALVDTPRSQVVDLGTKTGADIGTLAARANLLASLMTSSPLKDEIARRSGLPDDTLITPSTAAAGAGGAAGATIAADSKTATTLKASVPTLDSGEIPIIAVETQAPDPEVAAKVADQAIAVLQEHLDEVAGTEAVPAGRRVVVRELGQARSTVATRGPSKLLSGIAAIFILLVGCGAIVGFTAGVRMWRSLSESEAGPPSSPLPPATAADPETEANVVPIDPEAVGPRAPVPAAEHAPVAPVTPVRADPTDDAEAEEELPSVFSRMRARASGR
jgi:hypothetical protein